MTDIQAAIREYISEYVLFGDTRVWGENTSFQKSGILDSVGFLELITFIETKFTIEIASPELIPGNFDTLRKISDFVERKLREKAEA